MNNRVPSHQSLPAWLHEGARIFDSGAEMEAIVQFIGDWEDPNTRRRIPQAIFLRPVSGGREWVVENPKALTKAAVLPATGRRLSLPGRTQQDNSGSGDASGWMPVHSKPSPGQPH
ncbi:hypothetical protein ACIHFE_30640 [Streptomyces sp. NPDC052396]|uniref:hypothetical protein n=1 Tax=Streptomyces sp. NPDC052396 TaxID=3365689 RepID=UPI0037CD741B